MAQQLDEPELSASDTGEETSGSSGLATPLGRYVRWLAAPVGLFTSSRYRMWAIVAVMTVGSLAVMGVVAYKDWRAESRRPLGCVDQNAMMAIGLPSKDESYLVYVSERRHTAPSSPDQYALFPGLPVDSMGVSFFSGEDESVGFSSAVFCLDWEVLSTSFQASMAALQRGRSQDPRFIFGDRPVQVSPQGFVDHIPVFSVSFPEEGDFLMCVFGNAVLLSQGRDGMIRSLRALLHVMARLGRSEADGRLVRSFVEGDRRFRLYLLPPDHGEADHVLPRRIHQGLSVSLLVDMAFQKVAPLGREEHLLQWLTRKDGVRTDDSSFATDTVSPADLRGPMVARGGGSSGRRPLRRLVCP